ncbi:hypothetical protein [Gilvimarinus sp. DA14]|uniref:ApeP family dehydratase n=1 Tax=Gilvimarinus sp. DA14 TaxID=2956798 RepID=UPI0020B88A4D|nr:hypothetical protein [Gilvimarinus sp. DA14]UTF59736.1 hypothetical protein NHM04_14875 [Gilvimarinus sp. DA14]
MLDIERYIPHRPPMRLVDRVVSASPNKVVSSLQVSRDNIFYDDQLGGVPAWAGIEFMAQTAAVWLGLADERAGRAIAPAFLVSTRHYSANVPVFAEGACLDVAVEVAVSEAQVVAFNGSIYASAHSDHHLVEAVFSAYRPDDATGYLAASEPPGLNKW